MRLREPWRDARSRQRRREFDAVFGGVPARGLGRALEIGGGDAFLASLLAARCTLLATSDRYRPRLAQGREGGPARVVCGAAALPFRGGGFDFIFSSSVLEHVIERDQALAEMKRCLAPGGLMVHIMPSRTWKVLQFLLYYVHLLVGVIDLGLDALAGLRRPRATPAPRVAARGAASDAPTGPTKDAAAAGATADAARWGTDERRWPGLRTALRGIVPRVHGEYPGHLTELRAFGAGQWSRVFVRAGFLVHGVLHLPLYSGYGFGLERLRRLGERLGLSAHNALVVSLPGTSPTALPWFLPARRA